MDSIALMVEEHKNIKRMLKVIRKYCYRILKGMEIEYEDFYRIIDFIKNYADAHHHQIKGVKLIRLKRANFIEDDLFEFEPSLRVSSGLALADYAYQLRRPPGLFLAFSWRHAALC